MKIKGFGSQPAAGRLEIDEIPCEFPWNLSKSISRPSKTFKKSAAILTDLQIPQNLPARHQVVPKRRKMKFNKGCRWRDQKSLIAKMLRIVGSAGSGNGPAGALVYEKFCKLSQVRSKSTNHLLVIRMSFSVAMTQLLMIWKDMLPCLFICHFVLANGPRKSQKPAAMRHLS